RGSTSGTFASSSAPTRRSRDGSAPMGSPVSSTWRPRSVTSTSSSSVSGRSPERRRRCMSDVVVHVGSGKVRELYALDEDRLLLVASDRISTFDVVLPTEIPDKGRVLTGLSAFWFSRTRDICPNHLLGLRAEIGRASCRERGSM